MEARGAVRLVKRIVSRVTGSFAFWLLVAYAGIALMAAVVYVNLSEQTRKISEQTQKIEAVAAANCEAQETGRGALKDVLLLAVGQLRRSPDIPEQQRKMALDFYREALRTIGYDLAGARLHPLTCKTILKKGTS